MNSSVSVHCQIYLIFDYPDYGKSCILTFRSFPTFRSLKEKTLEPCLKELLRRPSMMERFAKMVND